MRNKSTIKDNNRVRAVTNNNNKRIKNRNNKIKMRKILTNINKS